MTDDPLFQPTVRAPALGAGPWRLASQGYVAFFGGTIAGTTLAVINSGRLGLPAGRRWLIAGIGAVALVGTIVAAEALYQPGDTSMYRIAARVVAVAGYLVQARVQQPFDRGFRLRGGEHASLWGPGTAAVIGGGVLQAVLLIAAIEVLR